MKSSIVKLIRKKKKLVVDNAIKSKNTANAVLKQAGLIKYF